MGQGNYLLSQTDIRDNMTSYIMQETAKYGVGKVCGQRTLTKEDIELANDMERRIMKKTCAIKNPNYKD